MQITATTKVGDIATKVPASMTVFERYGVDFCCGGQRTLEEAVQERGLQVGDVLAEIERAVTAQEDEDELHQDWSLMSPAGLVDHIEQAHHSYLRNQLPRAGQEMTKVLGVHGPNHPELWEIGQIYETLRKSLEEHLVKEEQQFFPAIRELEAARNANRKTESITADRVLAGLKELEEEHDEVGGALHRLHDLTGGYKAPHDACPTYAGLYQRLLALEADIHRHVHLENNVLIPAVREVLAA